MRLIDADALKKEVEFLQDNTWPEDLSARMPRIIEEAETIPAIPVEWLHKKREQMIDAAQNTPEQAIAYVLWMWQKEQEAR